MLNIIRISLFAVVLLTGVTSHAAPGSEKLEFWDSSDETNEAKISHLEWQAILDAYLKDDLPDGVNRFDYAAVSKADEKKLKQYLQSLQAIDPRDYSKDEQLAYWVNFYNALTIDVVLERYPVKSIKKIRFLASPFGPWDKNLVSVEGKDLSLNDIEHGILRPIWRDPRIHFAVNCASIGCPNLMGEAFTADNWDTLMTQATGDFINHPRGASVSDDVLTLSSIFDWYGTDFGDNEEAVLDYVIKHRADTEALKRDQFSSVVYDYDWSLNQVD